ncbi:MAG: NAD(P)H-dependent glycerol-3-phosphate dehydrogenase [bacterium]
MGNEVIGILGGGSWGTTLANLASRSGQPVRLWMRDTALADAINSTRMNEKYWPGFKLGDTIHATADLKETADAACFIIIAVPSHAFRKIARDLGDHIGGDHILVHATKGFELDSLKRMSEILKEETSARRIGALSGPNIAEEIINGHPAATVVASRYTEVIERAQAALVSDVFRVYGNRDLIGVEIAGALKNIMALCSGMLYGLNYGASSAAMLITRGIVEMQRLGIALGADALTFAGLSGLGDMIATCMSSLSRNYQTGFRLSKGEKLEDITKSLKRTVEGIRTTKVAHELARCTKVEMPIVQGAHAILYENADITKALQFLMTRRAGYEIDF